MTNELITMTTQTNFSAFIRNLILPCRLDSAQLDLLTDSLGMRLYEKAFTHVSVNPKHNYEVYEQLGDITVNKFLVWYFHNRFSHNLNSPFGVKIIARLRIKYGSKQFLSELSERLGFWDHIQIAEAVSHGKRMSLLEDVFESFIGVTEYIIDQRIHPGLGYISCYRILESWFNPIPIDLSYEQLFDSKTRLKELFDLYREQLGVLIYECDKLPNLHSVVKVFHKMGSERKYICSATSPINKSLAEQLASEQALQVLAQQGFSKEVPAEYKSLMTTILTPNS